MTELPPFPTLIQKDGQRETCPVVQLGEVIPFLFDANSFHLRTQQVWREGGDKRGGRGGEGGRGKGKEGTREEGGGGRGRREERRKVNYTRLF